VNGEILKLPRGALNRLRRSDPGLGQIIADVGPFAMRAKTAGSDLESLVRAIVYQQLSGRAAATIFTRFLALYGSEFPSPEAIAKTHHARLRKVGLSRQKRAALRDLCRHVMTEALPLGRLEHLGDDALIEQLCAVQGIGPWSAQMFLMFHLGRLDVWPAEDLGVQKALQRLHGLSERPRRTATLAFGEPYRPFRTVAAWYLWRSLEGEAQL